MQVGGAYRAFDASDIQSHQTNPERSSDSSFVLMLLLALLLASTAAAYPGMHIDTPVAHHAYAITASGSGSGPALEEESNATASTWSCSGRSCRPCGTACLDCSNLDLVVIDCIMPLDVQILYGV